MKLLLMAAIILVVPTAATGQTSTQQQAPGCKTGDAKGFAHVRGDPRLGGVGALPREFTRHPSYFEVRYNCTKQSVLARRLDVGVYDVRFPGDTKARVGIVSANSEQAASSSVASIGDGIWRVRIRGPLVENNLLVPREAPFFIVVF